MRTFIAATLVFGTLFLGSLPALGENHSRGEYLIKAAFIYNFAKFVDWPQDAFPDDQAPLILTVLGQDPFGDTLGTLANKRVRGRAFEIRRTSQLSDLAPCHILFIARSEKQRLTEIQNKINDWPVLTVSDMGAFTQRGGAVQFILAQSKIRFTINPKRAEQNKLHISSQLLRLAQSTRTDQ
ncbi:MAG: YfiR family protein [Desulfobacterales bacterium]